MRKAMLFLIAVGHFCVDSYAQMLAPVLPLVISRLGLSLTSAGFLGTITSLCSLSQPLLGVWADGMRRRYLVLAGLLMAGLFTPMLGIVPTYAALLVVLCLGGLGVAAFHPQVFSLAGELSGHRRSFGIALFVFGGTLGLGCSPLWVPWYATEIGLEWLPAAGLPGLLLALLIWRCVPLDNPHVIHGQRDSLRASLEGRKRILLLMTVVVILRSVTGLGFGFFIPVLSEARGLTLVQGGVPLSIYNLAGVAGALLFGYLGDRLDRKPLVWGSILAAAPSLYGYLHSDGLAAYALLAIGGAMVMASNSLLVAMAQELVPKSSGLASSLPLGFSWGVAGLTLTPIGYLAERAGVESALTLLAVLPVATAFLALFLPSGRSLQTGGEGDSSGEAARA